MSRLNLEQDNKGVHPMEAYFDNSATTRCSDAAVALMQQVLLEDYGNPSSLHMKGVVAE